MDTPMVTIISGVGGVLVGGVFECFNYLKTKQEKKSLEGWCTAQAIENPVITLTASADSGPFKRVIYTRIFKIEGYQNGEHVIFYVQIQGLYWDFQKKLATGEFQQAPNIKM